MWGDLRVTLASIAAYARGVDVVVGWAGAEEPAGVPENPAVRLLRQPEGITTGSEAWNWCATQTDAEELLVLGDDCVLHPDSIRLLLEDVELIERLAPEVSLGWVGARSNFVKGPQNIRAANGGERAGIVFDSEHRIVETDMIVPVAAWIRREVFCTAGGFPPTNWFADDVLSWDLLRSGHNHFVSRAYVHHVGERATGQGKDQTQLHAEGLAWLRANRPDFVREKLGLDA